jgi:hypothetical protein
MAIGFDPAGNPSVPRHGVAVVTSTTLNPKETLRELFWSLTMNWPVIPSRLLQRSNLPRSHGDSSRGHSGLVGTRSFLSLPWTIVALLILTGCSATLLRPHAISVSEFSREKDVIHFMVSIEDSTQEQDFYRWSQDHILENNFQYENPDHEGVPLYELHYHFRKRGDRFRSQGIAYLMWRRSETSPHQFEHKLTYIGSGMPLRNRRSW